MAKYGVVETKVSEQPRFLSWVIVGGIVIDTFSPSTGIINDVIKSLVFNPILFLGDAKWFPYPFLQKHFTKGLVMGSVKGY
ncbi:hypothetical protein [Clostridium lacusfryxellense]|uniref:hypothetical protein n=1 Tax=Clostridium lacusfryxellense TaxID=205328 RepID=UPI001C0C343B|nr:hypothetical protein [Clostridium lacusfryxellense]MBU3113332.1 hypothetical protein [Clostridium lacusfryxellense]